MRDLETIATATTAAGGPPGAGHPNTTGSAKTVSRIDVFPPNQQ
jgi:Tfp pilus assembly pilus retraction ATPase PilT